MTPKNFIFGFIKIFIWFEGGYLNFSSKGLSFSKIFFYNKYFPWVHPKLDLWSWRFSSCVDSTQMFFIGKVFEIFSFKNNPMAYGLILPLSKIISYRDLGCNLPPKSHLPTLCQVKLQIQQVKLPHDLISIYS